MQTPREVIQALFDGQGSERVGLRDSLVVLQAGQNEIVIETYWLTLGSGD